MKHLRGVTRLMIEVSSCLYALMRLLEAVIAFL